MVRIESLLSARLFMAPQVIGDRIFFASNLSGKISLYAMDRSGSIPEPLLPPHIALQNPELIDGYLFFVFPRLDRILVMIDQDGDENYQPLLIPIDGGFPEPAFGDQLGNARIACVQCDRERGIVYLLAQANDAQRYTLYQGDLASGRLVQLAESRWGYWPAAYNAAHTHVALVEGYTTGDSALFLWALGEPELTLLAGTPLDQRTPDQAIPLTAFGRASFTPLDCGLLLTTALFEDTYGLGYLPLDSTSEVQPVTITGVQHSGIGELVNLHHTRNDRYSVSYNIDGVSWVYEGRFNEAQRTLHLDSVLCGMDALANGVAQHVEYDETSDSYAIDFSSATSPAQLFTVNGPNRATVTQHTRERALGVPQTWLAPGEDASFVSHDGLRVSARLYLPQAELGYTGPRPLVYYIHGGPQSQERPDFTWFSMPLIQFLTLNGFAVFVPNVRGSTGYGLGYTKKVDRDWGGDDRLDHVHAMTAVLPRDERIDVRRAAVVGRSYGGYMTLTLAARHPELWSAAVDMFGPYDLLTFIDRVPEAWKLYFATAVGDPINDRDALIERSPRTYIAQVRCPMLVIQGQNDPRVIERESRDVVEQLRATGKQAEYLLFPNEGHDVLKFENRVRCYNAITDFFKQHLLS